MFPEWKIEYCKDGKFVLLTYKLKNKKDSLAFTWPDHSKTFWKKSQGIRNIFKEEKRWGGISPRFKPCQKW